MVCGQLAYFKACSLVLELMCFPSLSLVHSVTSVTSEVSRIWYNYGIMGLASSLDFDVRKCSAQIELQARRAHLIVCPNSEEEKCS
jgi:hypothetical protein